ncbi:Co2+/Mg2+ efflux protein ApaG [Parvularcula maris]|uniref:Protein ApaG n=1 Tax=Parvularcula maris TaxID=2965077 RepID=A0A9X2L9Z1_9PROT|nr:Co2+/Mg2+ efflux protein ApaG [Parvularcula maris]MCQ8185845.1 Co2+/Mg2+ efflux protein ApaG [Parvularcula maris]
MEEYEEELVSEALTDGIRVRVSSDYLEDESRPEDSHYVWTYTVRIDNVSEKSVTLKRRTWHVHDAKGHSYVVQGDGVVGEQPVLEPGDAFEYTSGTPLAAPSGMMFGSYEMDREDGQVFEAMIPPFCLDSPYDIARMN